MIITITLSKVAAERMRSVSDKTKRTPGDLARSAVETMLQQRVTRRKRAKS